MNGTLVLGVRAAVHGKILGEDIDGLVARATETVSQDVTSIAVLHAVVIQRTRVILSAGSGVGSLVQVCEGNSGAG